MSRLHSRMTFGLSQAEIRRLEGRLCGPLIRPSDAGYDGGRRLWNAMIDKRPALIVHGADAADVLAAVDVARQHNLEVAIRGGGHSVAGHSMSDGGITIDLSEMRAVAVDPDARMVRAEAGATLGELDAATQAYGLAVPAGQISHTGIAGLTLGGGTGWLMRKYGLTIDNLLAVEIITADGRLLTASAEENPDLFWAVRGGTATSEW